MSRALTLGPFALHAPMAKGGMGEVWRGVHTRQGLGVAVKFTLSGSPQLTSAFRNEVAQMARLDHPHTVRVLDGGVVPNALEQASAGAILAGQPWLAMELASAGSLQDQPPPRTWAEARTTLLHILDALAYAHALGVLHRDLKPANVLAHSGRDVRPGLKLTDFGLAHVWDDDRAHTGMGMAGTPEYMAPEQAAGQLRDQGPWTDLYAVGCMAWQLITGRPPFTDPVSRKVMAMHGSQPLPPLQPQLQVPEGVEPWLRTMLAKRPDHRYQRAADARWALLQTDDQGGASAERTWGSLGAATWAPGLDDEPLHLPLGDGSDEDTEPSLAPPLPTDWRREAPPAAMRLVDAGLGLWGLRPVPLVGRDSLRDRLWADLHEVADGGGPRGTLLVGPAGYGKTRLSEWLGNRARELGAAHVLWASHAPIAGPWDGLGRMVARQFRCLDGDVHEARRRIAEGLRQLGMDDEFDVSAMLSWLWPGRAPIRDGERHQVLGRMIAALGQDRPVLLVADHAQWGPQTLTALKALLAQDLPLLVLLTWQDDGQPHPGATEALEQLDVRRERVGAMSDGAMRSLVAGLLILDEGLAERVTRRAAGCPLFAVQLVGDWVQRGVLQVGEQGFELVPGEAARLPDDIHSMWLDRLAGRPDVAALEVGAALSWFTDVVGRAEWAAACQAAGVASPDIEPLVSAGLLVLEEGGWRFTHGMLRESLGRRAQEGDRWQALHAACAEVVDRARPARIGRHLLLAGRSEEALDPLLDGLEQAIDGAQLGVARDLLPVVDAITLRPEDERRGRRGVLAIRTHIAHGDFDQAHARGARVGPQAYRYQWSEALARCQRYRGMAAEKTGDPMLAQALLEHAHRISEDAGLELEAAASQSHLANLARLRAEAGSVDLQLAAIQRLERLEPSFFLAEGYANLAASYTTLGELDRGEAAAQRAIDLFGQFGHRAGMGYTMNEVGEIRRKRGRLEAAAEAYAEAYRLLDGAGHHARLYPLTNTAGTRLEIALLDSSQLADAVGALTDALDECTRSKEKVLQAYLTALRVAAHAAAGAVDAAHRDARNAAALLAETGLVEPDLARVLRSVEAPGELGTVLEELARSQAPETP